MNVDEHVILSVISAALDRGNKDDNNKEFADNIE